MSQGEKKLPESDAEAPGRRPARLTDGALLPEIPPASLLTDAERLCYSLLREDLSRLNCALAVDIRAVILAARRMARVEFFAGMAAELPKDQIMVTGGNGQSRMNPLYDQLGKAENQLKQSLDSLLLSPRSRSSSRLAKGDGVPQQSTPAADDEEGQAAAEML